MYHPKQHWFRIASLVLIDWVSGQSLRSDARLGTIGPAVTPVPANAAASGVEYFVSETEQLTPDVISSLAGAGLPDFALFDFGKAPSTLPRSFTQSCRAYPETPDWPDAKVWRIFDQLLDGALIKNTPLAAPCFNSWPGLKNDTKCDFIKAHWFEPRFQIDTPGSASFPLFEGKTCEIWDSPGGHCTLGGFPAYVVNVSRVYQIQLAVNFARNANLRLVIKNKGHDFNAKSTGGGGLSIYTNHLRDIRYMPEFQAGSYSGPAFKIGTGVEASSLYEAADKLNLSIVGPIARTVGVAGGYVQGGGHSPLVGLHGLGADQVLSMEVVLADGTFVSVSAQHHPDLFWAMRGGGGSTFGVVVSVVVAAYPKAPVAALSYTVTTGQPGSNISADTFWAGMRAFWDTFLPNADAGHYLYFTLTCRTPNDVHNCTFNLLAHWAHDTTVAELREWTSPYFTRLSSLGIAVAPSFVQYPSVVSAFETTFPANTEQAGTATGHTASRLFPRTNWEDPDLLDRTAAAFRQSIEAGGKMVAYNFGVARNPRVNQTNAATPAWRRAVMFAMLAEPVANNASVAEIVSTSRTLVQLMDSWRALSPGAGSYLNEGDINEPNFQQAFYGSSYDRLYRIKKQYDPHGTFYAYTGVGSEDWYTTDQVPLYPTTNGRLCRKP